MANAFVAGPIPGLGLDSLLAGRPGHLRGASHSRLAALLARRQPPEQGQRTRKGQIHRVWLLAFLGTPTASNGA